jgi:hypothetical protein
MDCVGSVANSNFFRDEIGFVAGDQVVVGWTPPPDGIDVPEWKR